MVHISNGMVKKLVQCISITFFFFNVRVCATKNQYFILFQLIFKISKLTPTYLHETAFLLFVKNQMIAVINNEGKCASC